MHITCKNYNESQLRKTCFPILSDSVVFAMVVMVMVMTRKIDRKFHQNRLLWLRPKGRDSHGTIPKEMLGFISF
jgi:hypothetical protein